MMLRRTAQVLVSLGILALSAGTAAAAEGPEASIVGATPLKGWDKWHVSASRDIDAYVARGTVERAPLVLMLQGSPCHPLFRSWQEGDRHRQQITLPFSEAIADHQLPVHFVAFDRRGLTSFDGGNAKHEARACTAERGGVSKEERVADAMAVIRAFRSLPWVSEVWVAGHSEGADVAMGVARAEPSLVRVVGLFAGAGPSQFFDAVHDAREEGKHDDAEQAFRTLDAFTAGKGPATYAGHPGARFESFAVTSSALDDLRATPMSVPVYVAHGTNDHHLPIASADLFVVEALRQKERPVRYLTVVGAGHGFENEDTDAQSDVLTDFTSWASAPARSVQTIKLAPPAPRPYVTRYFGIRDRVWFAGLPGVGIAVALLCVAKKKRRARAA